MTQAARRPRAAVDTSVLLSAERHELLFLAHRGVYTLLWSAFLIAELVRIRTEWAIKQGQDRAVYRERINRFVEEVSRVAVLIDYTRLEGGTYGEWLTDPDDEPLLATALVGRAPYVVSWNTRDFPPGGLYAGVQYVTPPRFLAVLYRLHPRQHLLEAYRQSGYRAD